MANGRTDPHAGKSSARPGRYARLRMSIGRHPADVVRLAVAAAVVLLCLLASRSTTVNPVELAIFNELQQLPGWLHGAWHVITWAGSWPGIMVTAGIALYVGRIRMGVSLTASGALAWVLAALIDWLVGPRSISPAQLATMAHGPGAGGFAFPAPGTAVAAALVTAAAPYLRRRPARLGWIAVVLVGVAEDVLGQHLPLGVFAGAVLGWGCGTLAHLALGAPGRRTSEAGLLLVLGRAGVHAESVTPVARTWWHPLEYEVVTADGEVLRMKVVRRLHRVAGPTYRLRRLLASLEVEFEPRLSTPRHEVEHEAYVNLLAQRAGIGTVPVLLAGELEHGPPFLIMRQVTGRRLSTMAGEEVGDALLDAIWADVRALSRAQISHHDLRADTILIDAEGRPRITDFTFSRVGGPSAGRPQDFADTLVSLASVVGIDRAVSSAQRTVGESELQRVLPCLQPLALRRRMRRQLEDERALLADLRERLADRIGCDVPQFRSPVRASTVAIMLAVGLAVYLLLPQVASLPQVVSLLRDAQWGWLVAAFVAGMLSIVAAAVSLVGSSPRPLPFWRTTAVQLAAAFTGRTTAAGIGFYAINIIYLERLGLRRSRAVAVLFLNRAVHGIVTAVLTLLGVLAIGAAAPIGSLALPSTWVIIVVLVVLAAAVALLVSSWGRRRLLRPAARGLRELVHELLPTLRHPVLATELLVGSVAFLVLQALGLAATLRAFTPDFSLVAVLSVYIVGATLGQLAPTPGGLGTVEAAMVAGLTAIGVQPGEAVAAVLASRLLTFWLPVLPGLVAFRLLQHHRVV